MLCFTQKWFYNFENKKFTVNGKESSSAFLQQCDLCCNMSTDVPAAAGHILNNDRDVPIMTHKHTWWGSGQRGGKRSQVKRHRESVEKTISSTVKRNKEQERKVNETKHRMSEAIVWTVTLTLTKSRSGWISVVPLTLSVSLATQELWGSPPFLIPEINTKIQQSHYWAAADPRHSDLLIHNCCSIYSYTRSKRTTSPHPHRQRV